MHLRWMRFIMDSSYNIQQQIYLQLINAARNLWQTAGANQITKKKHYHDSWETHQAFNIIILYFWNSKRKYMIRCVVAFVIAWGRCQHMKINENGIARIHSRLLLSADGRKNQKKKKLKIGAMIMSWRLFYNLDSVVSLSRASNSEFSFQCLKYISKIDFLISYFLAILCSKASE